MNPTPHPYRQGADDARRDMQPQVDALKAENARLRTVLSRMLDEFAASLNSGKAVGYTAGSMQRALGVIREAEDLLPE